MHADGYAGFEELYRNGDIREVACMAHIRRKFFDIHASQGSAIAKPNFDDLEAWLKIQLTRLSVTPFTRRS